MAAKTKAKAQNNNNKKKVLITDLSVEFLATKVDDYDVKNCFFKIIDAKCVAKLDPLLGVNADSSHSVGATSQAFKVPVWRNEVGEFLMNVKSKSMPGEVEYIRGGLYIVDVEFIQYTMVVEQETFKGYYSKIKNLKKWIQWLILKLIKLF